MLSKENRVFKSVVFSGKMTFKYPPPPPPKQHSILVLFPKWQKQGKKDF